MSKQNSPHERNTDPIWTAVRWVDGRLQARHRNGKTEFVASTTYVLQQLSGWLVKHDGGQLNAERMSAEYGLAFPPGWVPGEGMPAKPAAPALPEGWVEEETRIDVDVCVRCGILDRSIIVEPQRVGFSHGTQSDALACVFVPRGALAAALALWEERHGSGQ